MKLLNIIIGLLFLFQAPAYATVKPSDEQMMDQSHLVVIAAVDEVRVEDNGDAEGRGLVTVRIEKRIKGAYEEELITFSHSYGGLGEGDLSKKRFLAQWGGFKESGARLRLYLYDTSRNSLFSDQGIRGWILSDEWFGYEILESQRREGAKGDRAVIAKPVDKILS